MSKYRVCDTEMEDEAALIAALNDMGYSQVEVHKVAQGLYGYHGDLRKEKANIIVRRRYIGSAANDLGFEKMPDGKFRAHISDFDLNKHNESWQKQLKTRYSVNKVKQNGQKKGIRCKEDTKSVNVNGRQARKLVLWR